MGRVITIPYKPRQQMRAYHNRSERFACIVAHRRFGKTVAAINDLIRTCLTLDRQAVRVAYIAPYYKQAKAVVWDYAKHYTANVAGCETNESELRIDFPNGARLRLFGADNYDSMRGLYFDEVVLDEPADFPVNAWPTVIRPCLADRKGRATFIGTPKGKNSFWEIYDQSRTDPDWFSLMLKASDTGVLPQEELDDSRRAMGDDRYEQEFECSFEAAIVGAYYGTEMKAATDQKRITRVPHDPSLKVITSWDLGVGDSTAIWFAQVYGTEKRFIDYYESSGVGLDHYAKVLQDRGYIYGDHILPHDVRVKELGTGKSRVEVLASLGINNITIAPNLALEDGIQAVRMAIPLMWFDEEKCKRGIEALRQYQREFDERGKNWKGRPLHDWTSHGCLVAGSMVDTVRGLVPIEHIRAGDVVVTPAGYANVSAAGMTRVSDELVTVKLSNGSELSMTPEHKVFTTRGVVTADALRYDDCIVTQGDASCMKLDRAQSIGYRAAFIENTMGSGSGYGRSVASTPVRPGVGSGCSTARRLVLGAVLKSRLSTEIGRTLARQTGAKARAAASVSYLAFIHFRNTAAKSIIDAQMGITANGIHRQYSCTVSYGPTPTERYLMDTTSTTSTAISRTIALRTLNAYLLRITQGITRPITRGLAAMGTSGKSLLFLRWLGAGIQATRGWLGIKTTAKSHGSIGGQPSSIAKTAAVNTKPHSPHGHDSAVRIASIKRERKRVPVYDMTVDLHHCYFADGILVSNCDAMRYFVVGYRPKAGASTGPLRRNLQGIA